MNSKLLSTRFLVIYAVIAVLVVGGIYTYLGLAHAGKVAVDITLIPTYAKADLGDGGIISTGRHYVKAGRYAVTTTADGFTTQQQVLTISPTQNTYVVILTATSAAAKKWVTQNSTIVQAAEAKSSIQSSQSTTVFYSQNSIATYLPYHDTYYSIGYIAGSAADNKPITVTIYTESPRYRYAALKQLRAWGFDPTDLNIKFIDFVNPLGDAK